jgi:organic radical activating enzyme
MMTALAWNAVKKTLQDVEREELFAYIKSIYVGEKTVTISTGKPIVNTELKIYRELLERNIREQLQFVWSSQYSIRFK